MEVLTMNHTTGPRAAQRATPPARSSTRVAGKFHRAGDLLVPASDGVGVIPALPDGQIPDIFAPRPGGGVITTGTRDRRIRGGFTGIVALRITRRAAMLVADIFGTIVETDTVTMWAPDGQALLLYGIPASYRGAGVTRRATGTGITVLAGGESIPIPPATVGNCQCEWVEGCSPDDTDLAACQEWLLQAMDAVEPDWFTRMRRPGTMRRR